MIYFDTSVLAAYYTSEERSAEAAAIVAEASFPVVSDLAAAELNVAMVRKETLHLVIASEVEATLATIDDRLHEAARSIGLSVLPQTLREAPGIG